jgi:ABC-type multidrug transport system fused ATPase/permease subunit
LNVITTFASITWVGGWRFALASIVLIVLYRQAGSLYGQTSRDLRRLDSVTRSPLYATFSEVIAGVQTIRAFGGSTSMLQLMTQIVCESGSIGLDTLAHMFAFHYRLIGPFALPRKEPEGVLILTFSVFLSNIACSVWNWLLSRWISARFNLLSSAIVGMTAVVVLITPTSASLAGFALSFALSVSMDILFVARRYVQLQQALVAVSSWFIIVSLEVLN